MNSPEATIFGSSSPQEGSAEYQQAYDLAQFLVKQGFLVKTGGYYGTMEAASRGADDAGRTAIGVPMDAFNPKEPNIYCNPEKVATIFDRLRRLISGSSLITILPGQLGTLTEFFLVWEMLESHQLEPTPKVVCIGPRWSELIRTVSEIQSIKEQDLELIEVYSSLEDFKAQFLKILTKIPHVQ